MTDKDSMNISSSFLVFYTIDFRKLKLKYLPFSDIRRYIFIKNIKLYRAMHKNIHDFQKSKGDLEISETPSFRQTQ